jgi:hypothetical protein
MNRDERKCCARPEDQTEKLTLDDNIFFIFIIGKLDNQIQFNQSFRILPVR